MLETTKRKLPVQNGTTATPEKKLKKSLYKPPTVDELNRLHETENLFQSNLFRMQIVEIIDEIRIPLKYIEKIDDWISGLNTFLEELKSETTINQSNKIPWMKHVKCPLYTPDSVRIPRHTFQFWKPTNAFFIGSYRLSTIIGPNFVIDVCVEMPAAIFDRNDNRNLIYHHKRGLYLACLALKLKDWNDIADIKFNYNRNDTLKPIIEITPTGELKNKVKFHLTVSAVAGIHADNLLPHVCNVQQNLFVDGKSDVESKGTPVYNSTILSDVLLSFNESEISRHISSDMEQIKLSIMLLKLWTRQLCLGQNFEGFNGFLVTNYIVYLLIKRIINQSMSTYQIIRSVWTQLARSSWHEMGISMYSCSPTEINEFHKHFEVVFIDFSGRYNLCSHLSLDIYLRLRIESERALDYINSNEQFFRNLFIEHLPIPLQFDHMMILNRNHLKDDLKSGTLLQDYGLNINVHGIQCRKISKILRKGLAHRCLSLTPIFKPTTSWAINNRPSKPSFQYSIGVILNSTMCTEILDKGPQANLPEAEEFKRFWSNKSELRRFQDGSISEACVWRQPSASLASKRLISKDIITYLLGLHLNLTEQNLKITSNEFDEAYQVDESLYIFEDGSDNAENLSVSVIKSFDELGRELRTLSNLPLEITTSMGISPVFRYTEIHPILPQSQLFIQNDLKIFQSYCLNEAVLQLSASGKWPNDLNAVRRIKAAFHLMIARQLETQCKLPAIGNRDYVDILKDGFVFRLNIVCQKEIALLKKEVTQKGVTKFKDTPESKVMEKKLIQLPKLTSSLHSLYQEHSSYGPTVLLAKRWLYSQLMDTFMWPDECTEILIAYQYLNTKYRIPVQPQVGFFRFLNLLCSVDWRTQSFFVNFNQETTQDEIVEFEKRFAANRDQYPPLCLVTSIDTKKNSCWSENGPNIPILNRVAVLAQHSLDIIQKNTNNLRRFKDTLFIPSFSGYDVLIKLRRNLIQSCQLHDMGRTLKRRLLIDKSVPAADFNPVQIYLRELRTAYSQNALFFYDPCGGDTIAVLFRPDALVKKEFRPTSLCGHKLTKDGKILWNINQIVEDFKLIGKGLVDNIIRK